MEALMGRGAGAAEPARTPDAAPVAQPAQPVAAPAAAAAAAAPAAGKYVPKFKRGGDGGSSAVGQRPAVAPEQDRWGSRDDRPRPDMRPLRQEAPPARDAAPPARQDGPPGTWRPSRYSSSSSSSTWSSRRN